jgi:hypothetical protein
MQEHEYIKVIDRVRITRAIEQLEKVRPAKSLGGISEADLKEIIIRLKEWEEEQIRVVDVAPDV